MATVQGRIETAPHRVNEVKTSKKFKACFSENLFFQTPLTNPLAVSKEARTQRQLVLV